MIILIQLLELRRASSYNQSMDSDLLVVGFMVAIIILASAFARVITFKAGIQPHRKGQGQQAPVSDSGAQHIVELEKLKIQERKEAREMVERLVQAKLDVINNAIAMGASDKELERLDARLEKLVGQDRLRSLLEGKDLDTHDPDLHDTSLNAEVHRLREG